MKKILIIIGLSLSLLSSCGTPKQTEVNVSTETQGKALPNPKFYTLEGEEVNLESFKGKPLVLNLWASWCPPCREEIPNFEDAYSDYKEDVEFALVSLQDGQRETPESALNFIKENNYELPFYLDTKQEVAYGFMVTSIPVTYFINSDGTEYYKHVGLITKDGLEKRIEELIENNK